MKVNKILRDELFEVIERQRKMNNPSEIRPTLKRLKEMGYTDFQSKQLVGQCLVLEIFNTLKHDQPYNEERYIRNLKNLPDEPQE